MCLVIKKIKGKFWTDSEKGEQMMNMNAVVVAVGYGLSLLMVTDLILVMVNFLICLFSNGGAIKLLLNLMN